MKSKILIAIFTAFTVFLSAHVMAEKSETELLPKAKITKEEAQKTALAQVKNGTVKKSELEEEHGKLIWSFDISISDSKEITEVTIDAITGKVVSIEKENSKDEEKESKEDKDKDDKDEKR
jgi:hypothetical protein